ncbi:tail fiber domain-containing protein [Pseudomonas knackmussii]|uniref:tail fiber domain-containing protein n=1 Tax=Pseudomonas knackmussii TaxID=65741 RepID=UPI003BDEF6D8
MADTFIPVRLSYTGSAVTAVAEYQSGETLTHPGNLQLTGNGRLFQADFSNATIANRAAFQTSTANSPTSLGVLPNGTSNFSGQYFFNASDPTNASYVGVVANGSTSAVIDVGKLGTGTYLPLTVNTGGSERLRILSSGHFCVANTSADPIGTRTAGTTFNASSGQLNIFQNGNVGINVGAQNASTGLLAFYYNASGLVSVGSITTNGTTTAYNTSSDHRLKDNVADVDPLAAQARIMAYRPVTWTWKSNGGNGKGFIAHEAQAVDPDVATGTKDQVKRVGNIRAASYDLLVEGVEEPADLTPYGEGATWSFTEEVPVYQGMDVSFMVPDMVAMLQKMRRELSEAQAEIAALKAARP